MVFMTVAWYVTRQYYVKRHRARVVEEETSPLIVQGADADSHITAPPTYSFGDIVDVASLDLYEDEHQDAEEDRQDDEEREHRLNAPGLAGWAWRLWYILA